MKAQTKPQLLAVKQSVNNRGRSICSTHRNIFKQMQLEPTVVILVIILSISFIGHANLWLYLMVWEKLESWKVSHLHLGLKGYV